MDDVSIFSWGDIAFDVLNDDDDAAVADTVDSTAAAMKVKSYKRSSRRKKHTSRQSRKFKGRWVGRCV